MYSELVNIHIALRQDEELMRMLPMIQDVAIIEHNCKNVNGSYALQRLFCIENISTSIVKRIILLGAKTNDADIHQKKLMDCFPDADITITSQSCADIDASELQLHYSLIIHIGFTLGISDTMWEMNGTEGATFKRFAEQNRSAYFACILKRNHVFSPNDSRYAIVSNFRLCNFSLKPVRQAEIKPFCREKRDYLENCITHLSPSDGFIQCVEEAEQGCETCNQCPKYARHHRCPYAQHLVADYYRKGVCVPQNDKIAHQWEVMAARQGYADARIQVADDLKDGIGCEKDMQKALQIYSDYAWHSAHRHCLDQILAITDKDSNINSIAAVPYIAQQAQDGDIEMILKLCDAFQNGGFGLPKDAVQQEEWTKRGAECGDSKCMKLLAEMYETRQQWKEAYRWYKKLEKVVPDMVTKDKIEEVEMMMLTNGATPEDVTVLGENYLYGYFGVERNLPLASKCIHYANRKGIVKATGLLALMHYHGWEVDLDKGKAICFFRSAAEKGDLMSVDFLDRLFSDFDSREIIAKVEQGIEANDVYAFYFKGVCLREGHHYQKDEQKAFQMMHQAADKGMPKAQYLLSGMYAEGLGTEANESLAYRWLQTAAENGYYEAEGKWGMHLHDSWFESKKHNSFRYLIHAYEQGVDEVYWHLAQCYMHGYGTAINKKKAYPLYQKAAKNDILQAQVLLCERYFKGDDYLSKDFTLCAQWGEEAIRQGAKSIRFETAYAWSRKNNRERSQELYYELCLEGNAAAMNNYACGLTDPQESAQWFLKAANGGDDYGMWNIAKRYKSGNGIEKNPEKAIEMFEKSANKGHTGAMMDLARMYRDGDEVLQNGDLAVKWFKKAADANEESSFCELAKMYRKGSIIEKNIDEAIHFYKLAAEKGNTLAMIEIGEIYENGENRTPNVYKAVYWYRKAATKGEPYAEEQLSRLNANWLDENGTLISDEDDED